MKHDQCIHPATPSGRAACRKAGGPKGGAGTTHTEDLSGIDTLRELVTLSPAAPEKAIPVKRRDERNPDLIDCVARLKKHVERRVWDNQVHLAWNKGWKVNNAGSAEVGRFTIDGSKGQITVMWGRTAENRNSTKFTFRPWETSLARTVASIAIAFSLAEGR